MVALWSGTFEKGLASAVLEFTHSTDIDARLIESDLRGSVAHSLMLARQRIIPEAEARAIVGCLLDLLASAAKGEVRLEKDLEDVHLNVESRLISKLGLEVGGKVHAARSRNDQVAADTRLFLRDALLEIEGDILSLAGELVDRAQGSLEELLVGYTHGQGAQPITVGFWLSGHASAFRRDAVRMRHAYQAANLNPLGACALAGTSFPIDRRLTTELLGFDDLIPHALDATSARDYVADAISASAIVMSDFSRLAEEIVVWNSFEFGLIKIDDSLATGSSIMPQKRNPVVAELVRARAGRAYGALIHLLTAVKGVTTGYSCDLQEDKPPLWSALDVVRSTVLIIRQQLAGITFDSRRALELCRGNFSTATELANFLVASRGFSFRRAHQIVGKLGLELRSAGSNLSDLAAVRRHLRDMGIEVEADTLAEVLDPVRTVTRQTSEGGTSPASVAAALEKLRAQVEADSGDLLARRSRRDRALRRTQSIARRFAQGEPIDALLEVFGGRS